MRFQEFLEDEDPPCAIFSKALDLVFDKGDGRTLHLERLSPEARIVYLIKCFVGDLINGGFNQTVTNSIGNHLSEIQAALWSLGAESLHGQLTEVLHWFPDGIAPKDRIKRYELFQTFSDSPDFVALEERHNQQFWESPQEIDAKLIAYVRKHEHASIEA